MSDTPDLRSLIEGADASEETPDKARTPEKKDVEGEKDKVPEEGEKDEGGEKKEDLELDDEEDDEDEDEEEPTVRETKEPSTLTKLKKEPGVKELLKKYPEVEDNFFEARRYKEVFATVDAAKVASDKSETFDTLVGHLMNGDISHLLDELHSVDPAVVPVLINNFLPTVHGKSKEMFNNIVSPIISNMLAKVARDAQKAGDEDLLLAVRYINRHVNGDTGIPGFKKIESLSRRSEDATRAQQAGLVDKENSFYDSVEELVMPQLDAEINKGLDPDNVLTKSMRATLVRATKIRIMKKLANNNEHMHTMTAMKKAARADGFSKEYRKKIARVSVNAALELVPSVRARVKKKMFGNMFEKSERSGEQPDVSGSSPRTVGKGGSSSALAFDPAKIDWSRTDLRDAMDGDINKVTLKK